MSTFVQHTTSKHKQLVSEIKVLKQEAEEILESYRQQILQRTTLILKHAEEYSFSDDGNEASVQCDKKKLSDVLEMLYELEVPLHPYCPGCNRKHGGPHLGQRQHMGVNGCL